MKGCIVVTARGFLRTFRWFQCEQQYNKCHHWWGTLMRYFLFLAGSEPTLAIRISVPATARRTVTRPGASQRPPAGPLCAAAGAIDVPPIALSTDKDLAMAGSAVVKTGTGFHRHNRPMGAG